MAEFTKLLYTTQLADISLNVTIIAKVKVKKRSTNK